MVWLGLEREALVKKSLKMRWLSDVKSRFGRVGYGTVLLCFGYAMSDHEMVMPRQGTDGLG